MKKRAIVFVIFVLLFSMLITACGREDEENITDNSESVGSMVNDPSHIHSYGKWTTTKEATCKESGSKERVCACGHKETKVIEVIAHKYVNNVCTMCNQSDSALFVPDYNEGEANVVGSDASLNYTSQGKYIYFSNGNKINKIKIDTKELTEVYNATAGQLFCVNVVGDWIYFFCCGSTADKSYIAKVRTDGSGFTKIVNSVTVVELIVAKNTIFYTTIPANGEYTDFEKDVQPLYSISVNGGTPKQIHDGSVSDIVADDNYLYFIYENEEGRNIIRIKHGSTKESVLLSGETMYKLSLENSKLYFLVMDRYTEEWFVASISTSGGSYTDYGRIVMNTETIDVVGNKFYYMGVAYNGDGSEVQMGLVEYDLTTKESTVIMEDHENFEFEFTSGLLIFERYDHNSDKLQSLMIYNAITNNFEEINIA